MKLSPIDTRNLLVPFVHSPSANASKRRIYPNLLCKVFCFPFLFLVQHSQVQELLGQGEYISLVMLFSFCLIEIMMNDRGILVIIVILVVLMPCFALEGREVGSVGIRGYSSL